MTEKSLDSTQIAVRYNISKPHLLGLNIGTLVIENYSNDKLTSLISTHYSKNPNYTMTYSQPSVPVKSSDQNKLHPNYKNIDVEKFISSIEISRYHVMPKDEILNNYSTYINSSDLGIKINKGN